VRPFEVWGSGDETRDLLHVSDLARGCLLALERLATADPVNVGYGAPVSVREVVRIVLDAADYRGADVVFNPDRPGNLFSRMVDCTKARTVLGFAPTVSIAEGLHDTVKWYAASGHGTDELRQEQG
jgi:GDP-L-fucose synthase